MLQIERGKRKRISGQQSSQSDANCERVWSTVSSIDGGGAVVRFAARSTSDAMALVQHLCAPLQEILGLTLPVFAPG